MFFGSNKRKYEFENVSVDSRVSNEILMSLTSFLKQSNLTFTNWFEDAVGHFIANPVKPELGFLELSSDAVIIQSLTEDTVRIVDGDAHMYNMSIFEEEDGRVNLTLVRYEDPAVEVLYSTDDDDGAVRIHSDGFYITWNNGKTVVTPTALETKVISSFTILDVELLEELYKKVNSPEFSQHLKAKSLSEVFSLSKYLAEFGNSPDEEEPKEVVSDDFIDFLSLGKNSDESEEKKAEGVEIPIPDAEEETAPEKEFDTRAFVPEEDGFVISPMATDRVFDDFHDKF